MMNKLLNYQRSMKFKLILPRTTDKASDIDLRLSLITLKNAQAAIAVHAIKIERELKKRGVSKYIIHQCRDTKKERNGFQPLATEIIVET